MDSLRSILRLFLFGQTVVSPFLFIGALVAFAVDLPLPVALC